MARRKMVGCKAGNPEKSNDFLWFIGTKDDQSLRAELGSSRLKLCETQPVVPLVESGIRMVGQDYNPIPILLNAPLETLLWSWIHSYGVILNHFTLPSAHTKTAGIYGRSSAQPLIVT